MVDLVKSTIQPSRQHQDNRKVGDESVLSVENLHLAYGDNKVLKGVSFNAKRGEVIAFIGPSGTGKTSLLRCLNFLESPSAGAIRLKEITVDAGNPKRQNVLEIRRNTAMVFQQFNIFKHRNVMQNLMDPLMIVHKFSKTDAEQVATEKLALVGLKDKGASYPAQLSGGQLQRVGIARALAVNPDVILLDEPTSALDPELVDGVLSTIESLVDTGITILLVTHEMSFARKISNQVIFMENGNIVEQGTPDAIFSKAANERTRQFLKSYYEQ